MKRASTAFSFSGCAALACALVALLPAPSLAAPATALGSASATAPGARAVPERYRGVVLRLGAGSGPLFSNLLYEGNNMAMRTTGEKAPAGTDGAVVASHWQRAAAVGSPIFVLRDALFSQPDHPIEQRAFALMMPPSWVTAAVADVAAGRALKPLTAHALDDDAAWQASTSPEAMFGSFPASQRLYEQAHLDRNAATGSARTQIENARTSVISLAADTAAMIAVASRGIAAVAAAGAERIALSDERYFGAAGRRTTIVIAVENPSRHELDDEAKGVEIAGRAVPAELVDLVRTAIYTRRLLDGDLAIERYDIALAPERERAIHVLELLVPRHGADAGGTVWLWVNGGLDAQGIGGHDATAFIAAFRRQLGKANVDPARLRLLSKPHVHLPSGELLKPEFEATLDRYRTLALPMSVNFDGRVLTRLLAEK